MSETRDDKHLTLMDVLNTLRQLRLNKRCTMKLKVGRCHIKGSCGITYLRYNVLYDRSVYPYHWSQIGSMLSIRNA